MRLIQISDLHFGPHYMQSMEVRLLEAIASLKPETVVITGDLTQRAKKPEFRAAAAFLDRVHSTAAHVVVCPGNHDIPMYRVWERLLNPFGLYRRYIRPQLDYAESIEGATLVALNSVRAYTRLVEGHLNQTQLELCHKAFAQAPTGDYRILATHHPIGMDEQGFHHPSLLLPWSDLCRKQRVDIILTGHVHQAAVVPFQPPGCGHPVVLISCGTTTSNRGRGDQRHWNNFQLLEGSTTELSVESFRLAEDRAFESFARITIPRPQLMRPYA